MKKLLSLSVMALILGMQMASAADLPVRFKANTRTPIEVQQFMTRLFNQKCAGSIRWARSHQTIPFTTYEDDYVHPGETNVSSVYDVAYDSRYPRDMVATISIQYKLLRSGRAKVTGAEIIMGYDSTHCDRGVYSPSDIR